MARGTLDRLLAAAVNWTLIAYAFVLCVGARASAQLVRFAINLLVAENAGGA
jgi:hypothetical protein